MEVIHTVCRYQYYYNQQDPEVFRYRALKFSMQARETGSFINNINYITIVVVINNCSAQTHGRSARFLPLLRQRNLYYNFVFSVRNTTCGGSA